MKLIFHGGAQEVGRSCIELQTKGDQYLLDAGVKFIPRGYAYPEDVFDHHTIDGLFLTHAHLDHSGALPLFEHRNLICPIFCTEETKTITKVLLKDSYKVARIRHLDPAFERIDLKKVNRATRIVQFDQLYNHRQLQFKFFNAGHIPGSASIWIKAENKTLLYSGDVNNSATGLMKEAVPHYGPIDTLIVESTYGGVNHENREVLKQQFLDKIEAVLKRGGKVLIPTFALGRAQEILIMLSERNFPVPIYFDGMCVKITRKILRGTNAYLNQEKSLRRMLRQAKTVRSQKRRNRIAAGSKAIFVCTSGMMQGGPVMHYLKHMWHDKRNAVLLMGFQVKHTNGWHLLNEGFVYLKGGKTEVLCEVQKYDFSGHADDEHLKEYIKAVNPRMLIVQHGDVHHGQNIVNWAKKNISGKVFFPAVGDQIDL